jgi:hypothetical protein
MGGRKEPLKGLHDPVPHQVELQVCGDNPADSVGFSDTAWVKFPWSVDMLTKMLITKYPELKTVQLPFLHNGMKPFEVIELAKEIPNDAYTT